MDTPAPLAEALLSGIDDAMVADAMAFREEAMPPGDEAELEATPLPLDWRATISQAAYEFVVRWETGGRAYYERVIKGRPIWPGYSSGITIGCGFDLGYHTAGEFAAEWQARLAPSAFERLSATVGFRTTEPDRARKVERAKALVRSLSDIVVAWPVAIDQFDNAKLPKLVRQLHDALDNLDRLHPHSRGALLSLVFNRGASFRAGGDRFIEMREIRAAMQAGTRRSFATIPGLLRSMKRIWGADSSLSKRREGEAKLFEAGLGEAGMLESLAAFAAPEPELEAVGGTEMHDDVDAEQTDEASTAELEAFGEIGGFELESTGLTPASVRWHARDDEQPDYRHLDTRLAGRSFEFTAADLALLVSANEFAPLAGKMVFALRGAGLEGEREREDVASLVVRDQRPDHRSFRCIIGICDRDSGRLWAYPASTVPNAFYVHKCHAMAKAGTGIDGLVGNVLPTGCYTFTVGTHKRGQAGEIPGVLRLSTTASGASRVMVLRSLDDVVYDRFDRFPIATPGDNIHPAILSTGFSSAGCLTIPGRFEGGRHHGLWNSFRRALGMDVAGDGRQYSTVLLTGLDAALATNARSSGGASSALLRLRHGSRGARVAALQTALGLSPDASQLIGPVTRQALIARQTARLGWADGIHSPAMDRLLGFDVYRDVAA